MIMRFLAVAGVVVGLQACVGGERLESAPRIRQIVAHRGSSADRPECTIASCLRAIEAGATAVEVDVRTTKDGRLVILHDRTVDRTTNGTGPVNALTLAEVKTLDAGSWFNPAYRNERIPTLREVLENTAGKIDVLLDLKESGPGFAEAVVGEIRAHGRPRRIIVGVRSVEQAKRFRRLLPEARQLGLIPGPDEIEAFVATGVETVRLWPRWLDDPSRVARVRKTGAMLHLNGRTGLPDEIRPLLVYRPDSLSSDDPARLLRTLSELRPDQGRSGSIR